MFLVLWYCQQTHSWVRRRRREKKINFQYLTFSDINTHITVSMPDAKWNCEWNFSFSHPPRVCFTLFVCLFYADEIFMLFLTHFTTFIFLFPSFYSSLLSFSVTFFVPLFLLRERTSLFNGDIICLLWYIHSSLYAKSLPASILHVYDRFFLHFNFIAFSLLRWMD